MADETAGDADLRMTLEARVNNIASVLGRGLPSGVGFVLALMDFGAGGSLAYASSVDRDDCIRALMELTQWLTRQSDAEFLDALMRERGPSFVEEASAAIDRWRNSRA